MKSIYLALVLFMLSLAIQAQYQVTLKVIDNQDGALTNNVNDNNETNVFVWAADLSGNTIYTRADSDWWYAMYTGEAQCPNGELIKNNGVWTWQATFDVAAGDYQWNPHMKTLGWQPINTLYNYAAENNILFSVGSDGSITGQTTLELPLTPTSITRPTPEQLNVMVLNNVITVNKLKAGELVSIYNLSGQLIAKQYASDKQIQFTINQTGIYIIKSGNQSLKIRVK